MGILGVIINNAINMSRARRVKKMSRDKLLALSDKKLYKSVCSFCECEIMDINDPNITEEQRNVFCLEEFEAEVNNGGLCQFFVNSSSQCAPYVSEALSAIGANSTRSFFEDFIFENGIDLCDLSSFKIENINEYEAQYKRFDFDSFDAKFYDDEDFHGLLIKYIRNNIDRIIL